MKKRGSRFAIVSVLLLGLIIFGVVSYAWNTTSDIFQQPISADAHAKAISFEVAAGDNAAQVGDKLQARGLIRNSIAFRVWARIKGLDTHLQAGVYNKLTPNMTISQIIDQLLNGQPDAIGVAIPEGLRLEQIAQRFTNAGLVKFKAADFLKYTQHIDQFPNAAKYPILQEVPGDHQIMEGVLWPDTYIVPVDSTALDIVNMMLKETTDKVAQNNLEALAKQQHLPNAYQLFIVGSLVQREIRFNSDAAGVAGVFWNRALRAQGSDTAGFLGSDPSAQYARDTENPPKDGKYWGALPDAGRNIATGSPWNTDAHAGLPPTPICAPGLATLLAAGSPVQSGNYYFLSDNGGHIHYAKNLKDFTQLVNQYPPK